MYFVPWGFALYFIIDWAEKRYVLNFDTGRYWHSGGHIGSRDMREFVEGIIDGTLRLERYAGSICGNMANIYLFAN